MDEPEKEMPLSPQDQFQQWLESKWKGDSKCPICLEENWVLGEMFAQVDQHMRARLGSGKVFPLAVIFCTTCGYARFFNAIFAGLVEPRRMPGEASPPEEPTQ